MDNQNKVVEAYIENNKNKAAAARSLGMPRSTFRTILKKALVNNEFKNGDNYFNENLVLKSQLQDLKKELNNSLKKVVTSQEIKKFIYEIKNTEIEIPNWVTKNNLSGNDVGVPSIALSDWHWGEVIDNKQVMGVNEYNLTIAHDRAKRVIDGVIDVAFNHISNPNYPGVVVHLLGDMIAGQIHDELVITSEKEVLQIQLDIYSFLIKAFLKLISVFGKVFVVCVPGNHGRLTRKPRAKNYAYDSLDWHLYCLLQKWFEDNDNIKFLVSDGEDAQFKIYNWTYRVTHGAQFKGGDGISGFLPAIIRGDIKKRAQAKDMNNEYDILVMGHFHQHAALQRIICNGCLCGFSEYAFKSVFPYEIPTQSFWITHPEYGKTFDLPIFAERKKENKNINWVSWEISSRG